MHESEEIRPESSQSRSAENSPTAWTQRVTATGAAQVDIPLSQDGSVAVIVSSAESPAGIDISKERECQAAGRGQNPPQSSLEQIAPGCRMGSVCESSHSAQGQVFDSVGQRCHLPW